jgi:hypothetical protein
VTLPRLKTLAAVGASVLVLAGCGSARPGVAIDVEGQTVSLNRVDSMAAEVCAGLGPATEASGSTLAKRDAQTTVAAYLLSATLAEQFADEVGVRTSSGYADDLRNVEQQLAAQGVPQEHLEGVVEFYALDSYVTDIQAQAGAAALAQEGVADAGQEQAQQVGGQLFAEWAQARDVVIDPRYGIEMSEQGPTYADTDVSIIVSDAAAAMADSQQAASLPVNLRCS